MLVTLMNGLKNKSKGFTLFELVLTIVVVGIASIPLSLMLSQQAQSIVQSGDHTAALHVARLEMEKVMNINYAAITSASFSNYQGFSYDVVRTVSYVQGSDITAESLKKIVVDVKKVGSSTVLESLVTYIAKNVKYGPLE